MLEWDFSIYCLSRKTSHQVGQAAHLALIHQHAELVWIELTREHGICSKSLQHLSELIGVKEHLLHLVQGIIAVIFIAIILVIVIVIIVHITTSVALLLISLDLSLVCLLLLLLHLLFGLILLGFLL